MRPATHRKCAAENENRLPNRHRRWTAVPEVKDKIVALTNQQRDIDARIKQAQQSSTNQAANIDEMVDTVVVRLEHLADELPNFPVYQLRQVLAAMTESTIADMVTREVEMTLKLPSAAINDAKSAISQLCLQQTSRSSTLWQTQLNEALVLGIIRCEFRFQARKQCFKCRRLPRAARSETCDQYSPCRRGDRPATAGLRVTGVYPVTGSDKMNQILAPQRFYHFCGLNSGLNFPAPNSRSGNHPTVLIQ